MTGLARLHELIGALGVFQIAKFLCVDLTLIKHITGILFRVRLLQSRFNSKVHQSTSLGLLINQNKSDIGRASGHTLLNDKQDGINPAPAASNLIYVRIFV